MFLACFPAQHFVRQNSGWWLRCFRLNCAPHWHSYYFSYTCLDQISFFSINKLEEERKVFTPFDEKSMNRVKHKVHGRPLIHAHVRKIQLALASLVGSQSRQLSYIVRLWITKWLGNHQIVFFANPSPVLFPVELLFASMGACRVLEGVSRPNVWSSWELTTPSTQNPSTPSGPLNRSCP